jgi:hypothetical protein
MGIRIQVADVNLSLLNPKLVHADKCIGILVLENLPLSEVGCSPIPGKTQSVRVQNFGSDVEPQKRHIVLLEKPFDLGRHDAMFLNMEKKIAATADSEQIRGTPVCRSDASAWIHQVLAASAYLVCGRPITLFGDRLP